MVTSMAKNTRTNDKKVRELTAREMVMSIYPDAHVIEDLEHKYLVIGYYTVNTFDEQFFGQSTTNPNRAWRKAWKNIQQDMLEKLIYD